MAGFVMRKDSRLMKLVPVRYLREGITGEGIIKGLSLSGSHITGNASVSLGMSVNVQILVPGVSVPLLIDHAIVKWVKGFEFGVDFNSSQPKAAKQITKVITKLVKVHHGSSRSE